MKIIGHLTAALVAVLVTAAAPGLAQTVMTPANPQPDAGALQPGLAVDYAYPSDVKSLNQAQSWASYGVEAGPPLIGFDYIDTAPGENALTSSRAEYVVAFIDGFIHFDKPGTYKLEFQSNDGLDVKIGGADVYRYDGRHPCGSSGWVEVEAPVAGWYPLEALFFQRLNTSCLLMQWEPPGEGAVWTPNSAFAHIPG
jgi:hypothetical protein